jgi:signal transduction histidine kinase
LNLFDILSLGIGLSICRKIVERHRGKIAVKSSPGEGTSFIISLPLRQKEGGTHEYET